MTQMILLVMAEYSVGDSPLWYRGSHERIGLADSAELGFSSALRRDLEEWNNVFDSLSETNFKWPSAAVRDSHRVDAFTLAGRVQLELGDGAHIWCGAGEGVDMFPEGGTVVVAPATRRGTNVEFWNAGHAGVRSARASGAREETGKALVRWRALTERIGTPFGDAETRALGLRTAGRMQADIGTAAQIIFFAGMNRPYENNELD